MNLLIEVLTVIVSMIVVGTFVVKVVNKNLCASIKPIQDVTKRLELDILRLKIISAETLKELCGAYDSYKELGGNGWIDVTYENKLKELQRKND